MVATVSLASSIDALRISLHVLAACVWIGGQVVMGALVPTARGFGPEATKKIVAVFGRIEWPTFAVLVATGVWNVLALHSGKDNTNWQAVLSAKYAVVLVAGVAVYLHTRAKTPRLRGISAGVGLLTSLGAMVLGVVLAG